ncbi:MAG: hypothetical protein HY563_01405 [Ignavibacteriales bacterium]|nr:hypothetical protein [Ignavibacteriales bacterium]
MSIFQSFRIGFQQVRQAKRMILFAWIVNVVLALTVTVPLLNLLDGYIRDTVHEEQLLEGLDSNWFETFRTDNSENPLVRSFDYSITGYAPFLIHYEALMGGTMIKVIGNFFIDMVFRLKIRFDLLGPLTILAFVYLLASTFLAGGFIGSFAKSYRVTFQEFLMEGAKYFGKFFRISLLFLLVSLALFEWVFDWWTASIPEITYNDPSEWTPFVHYMIRNVVILMVLGFLIIGFDYAKIRTVVDDRFSALFASWAGFRFVLKQFGATAGLFLLLVFIGLVFMVLYALVQGTIYASGYWSILLLFVLQQLYIASRLGLRALAYASQTQLYQSRMQTDHRVEVAS